MAAASQADTVVLLEVASNNQSNSGPRIRSVPRKLCNIDKNRGCYERMLVSIDPFYHGRPDLQLLEPLKIEQEQQFISHMGSEFPAFDRNFDEVAIRARECYDLSDPYCDFPNDVFMRIMFRDGCFLLHFIYCISEDKPDDTKKKTDQRALVLRDLFLLENQLPFIVLKELMMNLRYGEVYSKELITKFIRMQKVFTGYNPLWLVDSQPLHLLDLLWKELVRAAPYKRPLFSHTWPMSRARDCMEDWYSFRTVSELKESGIECKGSTTCSLKDMSFKRGITSGYQQLPPIVIDNSTKSKFLNLVAYESLPDAPDDLVVTSYICFLDSLIHSTEDVKELKSKGILRNALGSDQQILDLFNNLALELVPDPELYGDVKKAIERHFNSEVRLWLADVRDTYFTAASLALLLTIVQTYFTVFPRNNNDCCKKP
ncbi:uncharacterized protein LOC122643400 [Telopea speciosissima]|uniref:uncharacterized protein LOC122643400 n=1 Tax=Telopea speciosissima TaxID=54955 RepID=UPI001CC5EEA1|nr:uncharacterized protein LOC122643400 [Telopea speciosissima]